MAAAPVEALRAETDAALKDLIAHWPEMIAKADGGCIYLQVRIDPEQIKADG